MIVSIWNRWDFNLFNSLPLVDDVLDPAFTPSFAEPGFRAGKTVHVAAKSRLPIGSRNDCESDFYGP